MSFCLYLMPIVSIGIAKVTDYIEDLASLGRTILEIAEHHGLQLDAIELIA